MKELFSLKTKNGCLRVMALCLALILLFGFVAHLIATDFGSVKITRLTLDTRGATVDADLYYPRGISSNDKLPAVIVAHGGGVARGVTEGLAEEFARRGYVVLNPSAFGAGISEQPLVDDMGLDPSTFSIVSTTGINDAVAYLRTLEYVDQTRIAIVGHSLGALRAMLAATGDCGYYTFNDIMINVLYETFGQEFTAEEITQDAGTLAQARLSDDQLAHYKTLEAEKWEVYNTRIKSVALLGTDGGMMLSLAPVNVAGHEVLRNVQTNFSIILGLWDHNLPAYDTRDRSTEYWHTTQEIEAEQWYVLDTTNQTSQMPGKLFEISATDNAVLQAGIADRSARVVTFLRETHSKNFFSEQAATYSVHYITQTLGAASSDPIDSGSIVYIWREFMNFGAMLSMIFLAIATVGWLVQSKFFAACAPEQKAEKVPTNKKVYWVFSAITVALTFYAMYATNNLDPPSLPTFKFLPQFSSWWLTVLYLAILGVCSAVFLVVYAVLDKKLMGKNRLGGLNFKLSLPALAKTVLGGVVVMIIAYGSLVILEYIFNEDYRIWMAAFGEMRIEYWRWLWRFALLMLPSFLVIGAATNYSIRSDIPQWKDTLITVVVNSAGVGLLCLVNYLILVSGGEMFSSFISSYGFLVIVPITVYITRKCYLLTGSIWFGAIVNSMLLAWSIISSVGLHCNFYYGQNWIMNFFGM